MHSSSTSTNGTLAIFIVGLTSIVFLPSLLCVLRSIYKVSCTKPSSVNTPSNTETNTSPSETIPKSEENSATKISTENTTTDNINNNDNITSSSTGTPLSPPPPPPRTLWTCGFICCSMIMIITGIIMIYYIQLIRNDPAMISYDPYKVLDLSEDVDEETIRRTYRQLSKRWHPDKPGGDANRFREISRAYNALTNPKEIENMKQYGNPEGHYFGGIDIHMIYNLVPSANNISGRGFVVFIYIFALSLLFSCFICPCSRIQRFLIKQITGIEPTDQPPKKVHRHKIHSEGNEEDDDDITDDEDDDSDDDKNNLSQERGLFPPGINASNIPPEIKKQLLDNLPSSGISIELLNNAQRRDLLSLVLPSTIKDPLSLSFNAQRDIIKRMKETGSKIVPRDIARILQKYPDKDTNNTNKQTKPIINTITASKKTNTSNVPSTTTTTIISSIEEIVDDEPEPDSKNSISKTKDTNPILSSTSSTNSIPFDTPTKSKKKTK